MCLIKAGSLNTPGDSNVSSRYLTDTNRGGISKAMCYTHHVLYPLCALA